MLVVVRSDLTAKEQENLKAALIKRLGENMKISIKIIDKISKDKSRKLRAVKNNIKL